MKTKGIEAENYPDTIMLGRTAQLLLGLFYRIVKFFVVFEHEAVLEKLDTPVIFAFNHNNYFETLAVPVCLMKRLGGKKGIGYLVLKTGAPVLPAGIRFRSTDHHSRIPSIGLIKLTTGEPVAFKREVALYETASLHKIPA